MSAAPPHLAFDRLRPPGPLDPDAAAYKDWLHFNVVHHPSGAVGLVNLSLHGPPGDRRALAVGTGLLHLPGTGWVGDLAVRGQDEARLGTASISLDAAALGVDHGAGILAASVRVGDLEIEVTAMATAASTAVEQRLPLGSGWVSWYAIPRLAVTGDVRAGTVDLRLDGASGYHDHNWGRWHWGDDLGWDWGCFLTPGDGPAFTLARTSDRHRTRVGPAVLLVRAGGVRRTLRGSGVRVAAEGRLDATPRRFPGALAALHADRARPDLPARLRVEGTDGTDWVRLDCVLEAAAQLIVADPVTGGYGFIHELAGRFTSSGTVGGVGVGGEGLAVVEHVD